MEFRYLAHLSTMRSKPPVFQPGSPPRKAAPFLIAQGTSSDGPSTDRAGAVSSGHQTVALNIVRRPKATPIHELERYMRCKDCSQVRGYPFKRSHLVALRPSKISALDPPSTWWPGER
jgi:hypothetical protein